MLVLDNVCVDIDKTRILHDISWQLESGQHWGVVGDNGSGKSSFLRLIAGLLWPAPGRGSRRYDFGRGGQSDAVAARRRITLVGHELQDLYTQRGWNFSALDVVLSGMFRMDTPRKRPSAADKIRARALLRDLSLLPLAERPFLELSRGEQRRVLIARGFAFRPAVLLLDEPASGLDGQARRALDKMIRHISRHCTLVCTAHTAAALPPVINRVAHLASGRITRARPAEAARDGTAPGGRPGTPRGKLAAPTWPRTAEPPLIQVRGASVWLGPRRVLEDVSWRLQPGSQWLIVGPNGAGKSTFLRLLHGQLRPARGGSIRWPALGHPRSVWELRRRVAWVSPELQAAYSYPSTVSQCVASGFTSSIGQTRTLTAQEARRIERLLEDFRLSELGDRSLTSLSYGQRHRVLIARAFATQPAVLLLDEPWEGLDPATAALVRDRMNAFVADGGQIVCASHLASPHFDFSHELELERGRVAGARCLRMAHRSPDSYHFAT